MAVFHRRKAFDLESTITMEYRNRLTEVRSKVYQNLVLGILGISQVCSHESSPPWI